MKKVYSCMDLEDYLNSLLSAQHIPDTAVNGIQVANTGPIEKIATAVSSSIEALEKAVTERANALIVHHGMFTTKSPGLLKNTLYKKVKLLIDNNIALLCYHLPLDAHRTLGNNCKAALDLGLKDLQPFAEYYNTPIGVIGSLEAIPFQTFQKHVENYYGCKAQAVEIKKTIKRVAIVSGAGEKSLTAAARAGADCLITGRTDEPVWDEAHEEEISFLALGHYKTETVGPKALAQHLEESLNIPCCFIETNNPF